MALSIEAGGFGATVCSIDNEGCSYPAESCFCRCQGTPCVYWSYWRLQPDGSWRYQPLGADNMQVSNGDVEAWRWAEGTTRSAVEPPAAGFEDICAATGQAGEVVTLTEVMTGTEIEETPGDEVTLSPSHPLTPSLLLLGAGALILPGAVLLLWALSRRKR